METYKVDGNHSAQKEMHFILNASTYTVTVKDTVAMSLKMFSKSFVFELIYGHI